MYDIFDLGQHISVSKSDPLDSNDPGSLDDPTHAVTTMHNTTWASKYL